MDKWLLEFLESTFNYRKLKKSRLKRKFTLAEVSNKTGIPTATLQRYEEGVTRKVPFKAIKKICELYKTNYNYYYAWINFPLFGTLGGMLTSLFFDMSINSLYNGTAIGALLGLTSAVGTEKIFAKLTKEKQNPKKIMYNLLEKEEKKKYKNFKTIATTYLETDEIIDDIEKEQVDNLLFAVFMMHHIRKYEKRKEIDFEEVEVFSEQENNN